MTKDDFIKKMLKLGAELQLAYGIHINMVLDDAKELYDDHIDEIKTELIQDIT